MRPWISPIALAIVLGGCSPLGVLNAFVPASGYAVDRDLAYGDRPREHLDVYRPAEGSGPWPVVVFFYGGRWRSGDRAEYRFVGEALTREGYVVVIPDTRLAPEVAYPAFLEDGAKAIRWTVDHASEHGGNPGKLFLMGHSAGAYNAMMLGLDARWLQAVGLDAPHVVDGVVGVAGPYDFAPFEDADLQQLFGPREGWPATQPINHADKGDPPVLLLQGDADDVVKPGNATRLADRLNGLGGHAEVKLYPGVEHYKILAALGAPLRGLAPTLADAVAFMRAL